MPFMKISVITAAFNAKHTIAQCMESVLRQRDCDCQYIVVDGESDDGTDQVIKQFDDGIDIYIREPDAGIYDALNKGISAATGEVVGFLHADDVLAHDRVLTTIEQNFDDQIDAVYGDLVYVREDDLQRVVRMWKSGEYQRSKFFYGWMPPHPTVYMRRSCYQQFGLFNLEMPTASDYEMMVRMMVRHRIRVRYIDQVFVKMRVGGQSNRSIKNRLLANKDDRTAWVKNGLRPPLGLRLSKPLRKVPQFLPFLFGRSLKASQDSTG